MKIRSITLMVEPSINESSSARIFSRAKDAFHLPVQTLRVATIPFPEWIKTSDPAGDAARYSKLWGNAGADFISLGPVLLQYDASWLDAIPEILSIDDHLSVSAEIGDAGGYIDIGRCRLVANVIKRVSAVRPHGFGNFSFAATANCPPGIPFFPVSYHGGGPAAFAIGIESADLALDAIESANSLEVARENLVSAIEFEAAAITVAAEKLAAAFDIRFEGIDFSFASFPDPRQSIGSAFEALGLFSFGSPGTLFSAAFLAEAIARANFKRCGFNGLMLPVLEDVVIARQVAKGELVLDQLLLYSAVCGLGLDIVPLPGDVEEDVLTGILLDVAALSQRLSKPLTARLLPLPGLSAGDEINFDFPYFTASRVMEVQNSAINNFLSSGDRIRLNPLREGEIS